MFKNILVAYDGSEGSKECLMAGTELSRKLNSTLTAFWVGGYKPYYHETKGKIDEERIAVENFAMKLQNEIEAFNIKENIHYDFYYVLGNPAKEIVAYAKKNKFDTIIIGYKGHSGLWENLLGHVADKVSENAGCNVIIVKTPPK
jgi:nucleotide-binding universal stress UspA family protein